MPNYFFKGVTHYGDIQGNLSVRTEAEALEALHNMKIPSAQLFLRTDIGYELAFGYSDYVKCEHELMDRIKKDVERRVYEEYRSFFLGVLSKASELTECVEKRLDQKGTEVYKSKRTGNVK